MDRTDSLDSSFSNFCKKSCVAQRGVLRDDYIAKIFCRSNHARAEKSTPAYADDGSCFGINPIIGSASSTKIRSRNDIF